MVVWRRWVFPILMVVVFGVIAASLTKLAFFTDTEAAAEQPVAQISDPVVAVERGSVANTMTVSGQIARDDAVTVRSETTGTVTAVHVGAGPVSAGQPLFSIKQSDPVRTIDVLAPEAGDLSEIAVVKGQMTSIGEELATLTPNRFHVLATIEPVQLYRLIGAPSDATVTITGGPAPFTCTGVSTQVAQDGTTSVRCAVPTEQTVFPGLPAELTIDIGVADDVLVVPTTAVRGGAGSGVVWVDAGDGTEPTEQTVTLGINDGTTVEVVDGLEEGQSIRQFVPGFAAPVEEYCYEIAPGEEVCETGVSW